MPNIIEDAILEAKQLREAAELTAQNLLHQKYANDLKNTIESLLEQDLNLEKNLENDPTTSPLNNSTPMPDASALDSTVGAPPMAGGTGPVASPTNPIDLPVSPDTANKDKDSLSKVPYAHASGETIDEKYYPEGEIEIDLDSLLEEITESDPELETLAESLYDEGFTFEDSQIDEFDDMPGTPGLEENDFDPSILDDGNDFDSSDSSGDPIEDEIRKLLASIDKDELNDNGSMREDQLLDPKTKEEQEKERQPGYTPDNGGISSDYERKVMEELDNLTDEDFEMSEDHLNEDIDIDMEEEEAEKDNMWQGNSKNSQEYFRNIGKMKKELNDAKKDTEEQKTKNVKMTMKLKEASEMIAYLQEQVKQLTNNNEILDEKLNESQNFNFKLLYMNKTLMDNSFNERQKVKIVETIAEAKTKRKQS
jgi:hypothetical protein